MPSRAPKICAHAGCGVLTTTRHCPAHTKQQEASKRDRRGKTAERGYGSRWRTAREAWLKSNPLCVECKAQGKTVAATVVDHIVPHRQDPRKFWSPDNWQSLCAPCHNAKTGRGE